MDDKLAIGIDLGTTFCSVSVFENGRVEVIANVDTGSRTTPSYVAFKDDKDEKFVGAAAQALMLGNFQKSIIFDSKRMIGRNFNDTFIREYRKRWPFDIVPSENGEIKIQVNINGDNVLLSPEEISAELLKQMKSIAEGHLEKSIENAVITIPAQFTDRQRLATKRAAELAGLKVLRLLHEPTAAAIAYSERKPLNGKILVVDFGGGTLDVSIVEAGNDGNRKDFKVIVTHGDAYLGGQDITNCLLDHCCSVLRVKHHLHHLEDKEKHILRMECENLKRTLSAQSEGWVQIPIVPPEPLNITKAMLENKCIHLFKKVVKTIEETLELANLEKADISKVILVGGSTRIPKVKQLIEEFFNGIEISKTGINPDEAIAEGAGVYAAILTGLYENKNIILEDVTPISLGIAGYKYKDDSRSNYMHVYIARNTPIPAIVTRTVYNRYDNQPEVILKVYAGENRFVDDNYFCGEFSISIPLRPTNQARIDITFELDLDGILTVSAVDSSNARNSICKVIKKFSI